MSSHGGAVVGSEGDTISDRGQFWLGLALVLFGVGAATVALLGPMVLGAIEYHVSDGATNQIIGGDVAGLLLVAPLSFFAGVLVWRHHVSGRAIALGPAFYGLYMYSQLAVGGDAASYPGNAERFFALYLGLFVLAGAIAISSWLTLDVSKLAQTSKTVDRVFGWFTLVVALFLTVGLHLPGLADAWSDQPSSTEYLADPVVFWLVKLMDLGIVVPVLVLVGIGVLRDAPWAQKPMYAAVGWTALLGSSVAGMAIVMQVTGDPAATAGNTIAFSLFAIVAISVALGVFRPMLGQGQGPAPAESRRQVLATSMSGRPADGQLRK